QGFTKSSGSLKFGKNLQAVSGITSSGAIGVNGNLLSQKDVKLKGAVGVEGNVVAENVEMGFTKWYSLRNLRIFSIRKHPYRVKGSIFAKNRVDVTRTLVSGDVKGFDVKIGRRSKVNGTIYFVNSIKIKRSAEISGEPIQVQQEELKL
ncbi:MAG: hypothetical protein KAR20_18805, partial [Candidatus Heimdallarchaeota archaeon]|nr:hypothetical protein [Candidatus Heimdallarchaeota archaeon]